MAVTTVFSEYNWKGWLFATLPRGYFSEKDRLREYIEWLVTHIGVEDIQKLKRKDFLMNGGTALLKAYGQSPKRIIDSLSENGGKFSGEWRGVAPRNRWVRSV